jgi:hypothetical protein
MSRFRDPEATNTFVQQPDYNSENIGTVTVNVAKLSHCLYAVYYKVLHCGHHYFFIKYIDVFR